MLWTIFAVVLVLWLLGFSFHLGGGLIHLLLVFALIVLVFNLLTGRRRALSIWHSRKEKLTQSTPPC